MGNLQPITAESWDLAKARHLLNRAGFGVPHSLAVRLADMGPEGAVDYLLNYDAIPSNFPEPDFLEPALSYKERNEQRKGLSDDEKRELQRKWQRAERESVQRLKGWWIQRMRVTPRPLEEKMALLWHGHFATSAQKVKPSQHNYEMYEVFRTHGTGSFKTLVTEVGQSRCMLRYLDNDRSTKKKPNENWARELMELFTLGQGQYTEDDIKESARSFTGWSTDGREFRFNVANHDTGTKTFLGQTGDFDGWDIIDVLHEQPALGNFICGKIWKYFAAEELDRDTVAGMADTFRTNQYELKPVLRQLFLSEAFYSDGVVGTQVKSPAQLVVELTHDLGLTTVPPNAMVRAMASLGQDILQPPNVKGWDGNRAWINANTLLIRYNLPEDLADAAANGHNQMMAGGGDAMMLAGEGDPEMMSNTMKMTAAEKQAARDPMAAIREQIREKLKGLPKEERQFKLKIFRTGNPAQKQALFRELGIEPPTAFNPLDDMFEGLSFSTAEGCVKALAGKLLDVPATAEQHQTLLAVLEAPGPDSPLTPEEVSDQKQRELLHMITSMAEYQLC